MGPWIAAPLSLLLVWLGVYCHRNRLAIFPEDPPGTGRHHHAAPTPMAGFLPMLVALGGLVYAQVSWWVVAGVGLATLTGALDDLGKSRGREMGFERKGAALTVAAVLVLVPGAVQHGSWSQLALAFLWLFAVTNAVNFLDNTDGVASSLGALGLLLIAGTAEPALAVPAACAGFAFLGFLPANWPRPAVFLGDSGALGLGLLLGFASLPDLARESGMPWSSLLPIAVFALDFTQVLLARLVIGSPPWTGDRRHLTHIAQNLGLPRVLTAPVFAAAGLAIYLAADWIRIAGP